MTMAMMITSSPEDLSNISTTIKLIKLVENMLGDHANYVEYGDTKITKNEIEHISDYFSGMHYILTNPGMTENELSDYEQASKA
ncbi:MAG: hypothetical protein RLZZ196_1418 [Bacteroidota bacterium]|jgi:hypothetical protein